MNCIKYILVFSIFLVLQTNQTWAQASQGLVTEQTPNWGWPVNVDANPNHTGRIAGTPGEYRPPYIGGSSTVFGVVISGHRYHMGFDVLDTNDPMSVGDPIYAIENCDNIITPNVVDACTINSQSGGGNRRHNIGGFVYWHVAENATIGDGDTIPHNNQFGTTANFNPQHLHYQPAPQFIEGSQNLLSYKLPRYQDNEMLEFATTGAGDPITEIYLNSHKVEDKTSGTNLNQWDANQKLTNTVSIDNKDHIIVFDKIDLVVGVNDEHTAIDGSGNDRGHLGANQAHFNIFNAAGQSVSNNWIEWYSMDELPPYATAATSFGWWASASRPRYVVTNHVSEQPYDRFWNTKLAIGQNETYDTTNARSPLLDADLSSETYFPDGTYSIRYRIRDIDVDGPASGNTAYDTSYVVIDNFRPYVERVYTHQNMPGTNGNTVIYDGEWCRGSNVVIGNLVFNDCNIIPSLVPSSGFESYMHPDHPATIEITTSEPMRELKITGLEAHSSVSVPMALPNTLYPIWTSNDKKTFHFTLDVSAFFNNGTGDNTGFYFLYIEGKDLAGNELLGFERDIPGGSMPDLVVPLDINIASLPQRISKTAFSTPAGMPPGSIDRMHGLRIENYCSGGNLTEEEEIARASSSDEATGRGIMSNCLEVDFSPSANTAQVNVDAITISPNVTGGTAPYDVTLDYGDGYVQQLVNVFNINQPINPAHVYTSTGLKSVELTVEDNDGLIQSLSKTDIINVYAGGSPGSLTAFFNTNPDPANANSPVSFQSTVLGGAPPYNYSWDFGDGNTSTAANPSHSYGFQGAYTINLTVTDNNGHTSSDAHTIVIKAPFGPKLRIVGINHAAFQGIFTVDDVDVSDNNFSWTFGDGNTASFGSHYEVHNYPSSGTYTVSVRIWDPLDPSRDVTLSETFDILPLLNANFSCPSGSLNQGGTFTFINTSNSLNLTPNEGVYQYKWQVKYLPTGNNIINTNWSTSPNLTHTFLNLGQYEIKLKVRLNIPWNICIGPICQAETTCVVDVTPCGNNGFYLPKEPLLTYFPNTVNWFTGNLQGCGDSKLAVIVEETSLIGITGVNLSDYEWEFEHYRIKTNGYGKKTYDVIHSINGQANKAALLFDYNEFNGDNGTEQYYVRITLRETGCSNEVFTDQLICFNCNGGAFDHTITVYCPFEWDDIYGNGCNRTTDFTNTTPGYPNVRLIEQKHLDRYENRDAYLFNGLSLQSQGTVNITNNKMFSFKAADEVLLKPGFSASYGARFAAMIGDPTDCFIGFNQPLVEEENSVDLDLDVASSEVETEAPTMHIYPNPAGTDTEVLIDVSLPEDQPIKLQIVNMQGRVVQAMDYKGQQGLNLFMLPTNNFTTGLYIVRVQTKDVLLMKKLIIQAID